MGGAPYRTLLTDGAPRTAEVSKWIARAVDLAASLPEQVPAIAPAPIEHAPGRRFELAKLDHSWLQLEHVLACRLISGPDGALLHTADGLISLATPPDGVARLTLAESLAAVLPDARTLTLQSRQPWDTLRRWRVGEQTFGAPGDMALGFDSHHPVGSNYPRRVVLAPDLSLVSYHFDHDVLVTSALPIGWRGAGVLDVADFSRDPKPCAVFHS